MFSPEARLRMFGFTKKAAKTFLNPILYLTTYLYTYLFAVLFSESKIHELVYRSHLSSSKKTAYPVNTWLFCRNYYILPRSIQRKLISSSIGNDEEGVTWAEHYRRKGFPDEHSHVNFAYNYLKEYIDKYGHLDCHIHQICASSGREVNYFSGFSASLVFEASDLTDAIADNIKSSYPHLDCYTIDISDPNQVLLVASRCRLLFTFGGLQYLLPEDLEVFFKACMKGECEIIISQPIDSSISPYSLKKSVPRGNFSWSHPYIHLANKSGYKVYKASTGYIPEHPWAQSLYAHFTL